MIFSNCGLWLRVLLRLLLLLIYDDCAEDAKWVVAPFRYVSALHVSVGLLFVHLTVLTYYHGSLPFRATHLLDILKVFPFEWNESRIQCVKPQIEYHSNAAWNFIESRIGWNDSELIQHITLPLSMNKYIAICVSESTRYGLSLSWSPHFPLSHIPLSVANLRHWTSLGHANDTTDKNRPSNDSDVNPLHFCHFNARVSPSVPFPPSSLSIYR